jgi:hypothetical protein
MSAAELAGAAVVPVAVITAFEAGVATPSRANIVAIQTALKKAGVVFLDGGGGGPGVRLHS